MMERHMMGHRMMGHRMMVENMMSMEHVLRLGRIRPTS